MNAWTWIYSVLYEGMKTVNGNNLCLNWKFPCITKENLQSLKCPENPKSFNLCSWNPHLYMQTAFMHSMQLFVMLRKFFSSWVPLKKTADKFSSIRGAFATMQTKTLPRSRNQRFQIPARYRESKALKFGERETRNGTWFQQWPSTSIQ